MTRIAVTMNVDSVDLVNVGELTPIPGEQGTVRLSRYPSFLEEEYSLPNGKTASRQSTGCEVRLISSSPKVTLRISSPDKAIVQYYQGDFWMAEIHELEEGRIHQFSLDVSDQLRRLPTKAKADCLFSIDIIRFVVERGTVHLHEIDTHGFDYRKTSGEKQPKLKWLAWGSSITQAAHGYAHQAACRLGVQLLNKGLSGSCGAEPSVATWLADDVDWDFATLEWGINLRGDIGVSEFRTRVNRCLDIFLRREKPVFLLTNFPCDAFLEGMIEEDVSKRQQLFDDIIRDAYVSRKDRHPNLHLVEGKEVLSNWTWLIGDLVHPSKFGHSCMGEKLADIIRKKIPVISE